LSGIFVTEGKKQKKNICKTYTHLPHRRLRKTAEVKQLQFDFRFIVQFADTFDNVHVKAH